MSAVMKWVKVGSSEITISKKGEKKIVQELLRNQHREISKILPGRYVVLRTYWGNPSLTITYSRCADRKCKLQYKITSLSSEVSSDVMKFDIWRNSANCDHKQTEIPRPRPLKGI